MKIQFRAVEDSFRKIKIKVCTGAGVHCIKKLFFFGYNEDFFHG